MDNCIFRAMGPEEAPRMIELVRERIAWMDREGLQSWNTSDYLEIYPQDYYEERAREGVLFALARASDGKILCAGALLETALVLLGLLYWTVFPALSLGCFCFALISAAGGGAVAIVYTQKGGTNCVCGS